MAFKFIKSMEFLKESSKNSYFMGLRDIIVTPSSKDKIRYTSYVSPGSQISHIATNKGDIKNNA